MKEILEFLATHSLILESKFVDGEAAVIVRDANSDIYVAVSYTSDIDFIDFYLKPALEAIEKER